MNTRKRSVSEKTMAPGDRHQMSLMNVFRQAHRRRDATAGEAEYVEGDRAMSVRVRERRVGTDEETLRRHLSADMASLMNTVNLGAAIGELDDHPYVQKSVVNFGFGDLSHLAGSAEGPQKIAELIRKTLIAYEPRLIAESLEVTVASTTDVEGQRLTFNVAAEMIASPVDIPLNFVAEVDNGAGKIAMTKVQVKT